MTIITGLISKPCASCPACAAASMVVPLPFHGSITLLPGFDANESKNDLANTGGKTGVVGIPSCSTAHVLRVTLRICDGKLLENVGSRGMHPSHFGLMRDETASYRSASMRNCLARARCDLRVMIQALV